MTIDLMNVWKQTRAVLALRKDNPEEAYRRLVALYTDYLSQDLSAGDRGHIMGEFASMQSLLDRKNEARATAEQMLELFPDSFGVLLHCSSFFTYEVAEPGLAVELARRAVVQTGPDGDLTIYALNHLCRVARGAGRFDVMQETMERLLVATPRRGMPMQHLERDYLKALPDGPIPRDLLARFLTRCDEDPVKE